MDKNILEYQKLDMKLNKINREVSAGQNKTDTQLSAKVKEWQQKILQLEQEAKQLMQELEKLLEVQKKGMALVDKFVKTDISKMSTQELKDFDAKTTQTANQLAELDSRIMAHNAKAKKVVLDYQMYKKKILEAKQTRESNKQKIDELSKQKAPDVLEIKSKIQELEKNIDPTLLAKYKAKKQEVAFPLIVPLIDKRCGGCRMELSASALDKLKNNGFYECEQCRRVIYTDETK